jgi:hypothetical protein
MQLRSYLEEIVAASVYKPENTVVGIRCADHSTPSVHKKLALTSPTSGGRSAGIVRSRTKVMDFFYSNLQTLSGIMTTRFLGVVKYAGAKPLLNCILCPEQLCCQVHISPLQAECVFAPARMGTF